jgi:hypothetical protein
LKSARRHSSVTGNVSSIHAAADANIDINPHRLCRSLAKLRDKNLLRVKGNTITVQKPRELQKLLQENLGEL